MIKILFADSDKVFIELGKTYLRKTGVEVLSCLTGMDALAIAERENPDLIFMSTNLIDSGGLECLNGIKSHDAMRDIPVIMVSTLGDDEQTERCRFAGCDEIIHKPVSRQLFRSTVSKFLNLEKRLSARLDMRIPVSCRLTPESFVSGFSVNLGVGGLFVESNVAVPVDAEITVDFSLPTTDTRIRCMARVAWANCGSSLAKPCYPHGLGLQFLDLKQEDVTALKEYLKNEFIGRMI